VWLPADRTLVILLFCLTAGIRLFAIAATFKGNDQVPFWEDVSIARNLVAGNGYSLDNEWRTRMVYGNMFPDIEKKIANRVTAGTRPTTFKQPGFPFFLAAVFWIFGSGNFLALFVAHSLLAGLTAVTLFLALRIRARRIGLALALGFALYPPFIYQCATSPESTILLIFLLSVFLYQMANLSDAPTVARFASCGAVAGIIGMTNPGTLIFTTLALCAAAAVFCDGYAGKLKCAMAAGVVVWIAITPWFIRNYVVFHKVVMRVSTGSQFLKTWSEAGEPSPLPEETVLDLERRGRSMDEAQEGEMLAAAIKSALQNSNLQARPLIAMNLFYFWWEPARYRNNYSFSYMAGRRVPYYLLLILSVPVIVSRVIETLRVGVPHVREHWIECVAMLLMISETAVYSYVGGWNVRYHYVTEFAMMLFAAQGALAVSGWAGRRLITSRRIA